MGDYRLPLRRNGSDKTAGNKLFVGKNSRYDMMFVILFHNNLKEKELPVSNHLSLQKGKNTHTNEK